MVINRELSISYIQYDFTIEQLLIRFDERYRFLFVIEVQGATEQMGDSFDPLLNSLTLAAQRTVMISALLCLILTAVLTCAGSNSAAHCSNRFPHEGVWSVDPPHWTPSGCSVRAFNQSSAAQCLKGKTIYVVGSSVARNYAFEMAELLGAKEMTRTDQVGKCQHAAYTWDGCIDEVAGVKFKVLYLQYVDGLDYSSRGGFKHLNARPKLTKDRPSAPRSAADRQRQARKPTGNDLLSLPYSYSYPDNVVFSSPRDLQKWAAPLDVCFNLTAADCLRPFFHGSTTNDLLILSIGLNYAVNMIDFSPVNYTSWISESVLNFRQAVGNLFPGRVFRGTLSEVRNLKKDLVEYNKYIWRTEKLISSLLNGPTSSGTSSDNKAVSSSAMPWFTVDQWSINRGRADQQYYQDFVHFHGPLTQAFLHNLLSEYCTS